MKKIIYIALLSLSFTFIVNAQSNEYAKYSLFADQKASRIGDAITILVVESSQATNNSELTSGRSGAIGVDASGSVGESTIPNVDFGMSTSNEFEGGGRAQTSGMIRTKISARIDSVLQNGDMVIRGSRFISINGEEQELFIKGIVRQADVQSDNTVYSYHIAEAKFVFESSGMISRSTEPGWLTKFFHWLF